MRACRLLVATVLAALLGVPGNVSACAGRVVIGRMTRPPLLLDSHRA